jgi:hypothetical protein
VASSSVNRILHAAPFGIAVVAIALLLWVLLRGSDSSVVDINPRIPPAEFLYLDSARVLAYLSELEDGLSESERRTISETQSVNAAVVGQVGGGASRQEVGSVERLVTPTAASRFNRLRNLLEDRKWLRKLDRHSLTDLQTRNGFFNGLGQASEGQFVEISHVRLTVPPPITVYRFARRSGDPDVAKFVRLVGINPRLPLSLMTEGSPLVLLVGRYASLIDEPSPFFGEVTVLGKMIRWLPESPPIYIDQESLATYGPALSSAPRSILQKLKIRPCMPRRKCGLAQDLKRDVTVSAPGAVILLVAVYK